MKVMMIGFSGAGKTSYMGGLYSLLNVQPCVGFSLRAKDPAAEDNFFRIGGNIFEHGIYPKGTDILADYQFSLVYNDQKLLDFDWHDYRGGVLADADSTDFDTVISQIMSSDALVVFLDWTMFAPGRMTERRCQTTIQRIMALVQNVTAQLDDEAGFPISFVLTKSDCIPDGACETNGWKTFMQVVDTISQGSQVRGLLTATKIRKEAFVNLQYPFLFSMWKALNKKIDEIMLAHQEAAKWSEIYNENSDIIDDAWTGIKNWWNGTNELSNSDRALQSAEEANQLYEWARWLNDGPLEDVTKYLIDECQNDETFVRLF